MEAMKMQIIGETGKISQGLNDRIQKEAVKIELLGKTSDTAQDVNEMKCDRCQGAETSNQQSQLPSEKPQNNGRKKVHTARRPWITEEFMQRVQQRDELYSKVKKNPGDSALKKQYSACRNQTAALRRKLKYAYQMYLEEL